MASVTPLLAVWDTAGVVRMYEYTGGVFVQVGALGGFTHVTDIENTYGAQRYPSLYWVNEDAACFVVNAQTSTTTKISALSPTATEISTTDVPPLGTNRGDFRAVGYDHRVIFIGKNEPSTNDGRMATLEDGLISLTAHTWNSSNNKVREISPDLSLSLRITTSNVLSLFEIMTSPEDVPPISYSPAKAAPALTISPDLVKVAYDNSTFIFADRSSNRAQSWSYSLVNNSWTFNHEISLPAGVPLNIAMSPDARKVAISTIENDSVLHTRIYRRTGAFFIAEQDFTGLGRLLDFTSDGVFLVDAWSRKALRRQDEEENFVVADSAVASLPVGIRAQGLSLGRTDDYGQPYLYDGAIAAFSSSSVDLNNLKITLLSSDAVFSSADETLSAATGAGAWELASGGWPAGGILLENVVTTSGPGFYSISSDVVSRIIIETGVQFRNILVYDASTNIPLIFVDLVQDRAFAKNREILFDFRDGEFFKVSS